MNDVLGYGLLKDGKPYGLWPVSLTHCRERAAALEYEHKGHTYQIVPVYCGMPVALKEPPQLFPPPALELA